MRRGRSRFHKAGHTRPTMSVRSLNCTLWTQGFVARMVRSMTVVLSCIDLVSDLRPDVFHGITCKMAGGVSKYICLEQNILGTSKQLVDVRYHAMRRRVSYNVDFPGEVPDSEFCCHVSTGQEDRSLTSRCKHAHPMWYLRGVSSRLRVCGKSSCLCLLLRP